MHPNAVENVGRYVTVQKDLGGFNNVRLSLECGVAFAAATGRTFVIPPPYIIWNMNENIRNENRKELVRAKNMSGVVAALFCGVCGLCWMTN